MCIHPCIPPRSTMHPGTEAYINAHRHRETERDRHTHTRTHTYIYIYILFRAKCRSDAALWLASNCVKQMTSYQLPTAVPSSDRLTRSPGRRSTGAPTGGCEAGRINREGMPSRQWSTATRRIRQASSNPYIYIYICVCVSRCICIYANVHAYTFVYIYIYTHVSEV